MNDTESKLNVNLSELTQQAARRRVILRRAENRARRARESGKVGRLVRLPPGQTDAEKKYEHAETVAHLMTQGQPDAFLVFDPHGQHIEAYVEYRRNFYAEKKRGRTR